MSAFVPALAINVDSSLDRACTVTVPNFINYARYDTPLSIFFTHNGRDGVPLLLGLPGGDLSKLSDRTDPMMSDLGLKATIKHTWDGCKDFTKQLNIKTTGGYGGYPDVPITREKLVRDMAKLTQKFIDANQTSRATWLSGPHGVQLKHLRLMALLRVRGRKATYQAVFEFNSLEL